MNRRQLLAYSLHAVSATIAAVIGIPVLIKSLSPILQSEKGEDWQPLGPLDGFPKGKIVPANVRVSSTAGKLNNKGVFVWRKDDSQLVVYSRSCTDLGCPLTFDAGSEWFYCPCHGGIFDKEGNRRAGPPKYPMWRYSTRINGGVVEIDLRSVPPMA